MNIYLVLYNWIFTNWLNHTLQLQKYKGYSMVKSETRRDPCLKCKTETVLLYFLKYESETPWFTKFKPKTPWSGNLGTRLLQRLACFLRLGFQNLWFSNQLFFWIRFSETLVFNTNNSRFVLNVAKISCFSRTSLHPFHRDYESNVRENWYNHISVWLHLLSLITNIL